MLNKMQCKNLIYKNNYIKESSTNTSRINLLRNKILDNWTDVIDITKNIQNQLNEYKIKYELLKNSNEDIKFNYDEEIKLLKQDNILIKDYIEEVKMKLNDDEEIKLIKANNAKMKDAIKIILGKLEKK